MMTICAHGAEAQLDPELTFESLLTIHTQRK